MKEVAEKLKMKSTEAAARWCIDKNIGIMTLGKKKVVSEFEFMLSFEKPLIDILKLKWGDNWFPYYEVYKNEDVKMYYDLKMNNHVSVRTTSTFNPDVFLNEIGYGLS